MIAASSPPPRDGEVCTCPTDGFEHEYETCEACHLPVRPAAPSEPPAADSPTPGTHSWWCNMRPGGNHDGCNCPAAPSPVDTTGFEADAGLSPVPNADQSLPTPAEPQQDERERAARQEWTNTANFAMAFAEDRLRRGVLTSREIADTMDEAWEHGWRAALAARPSADTETLREQVETWIDEAPEQTAGLDLLRQIIGRPR